MDWSTACPGWESRVVEGRSLIPFAPLFPAEAESALDVFRELRAADVAGTPMLGDICRDWILDFVRAVFGAYDAETGRRLITEFFLSVSKKNAKSTLAAGIMLTALIRNWRDSAEFLIVAPTIEIANNSFFPARDMVRRNDALADLLHVQDHYRTITHQGNGATLKVVAADNETVSGKKATGVLIDELWLFGKRPHAENMLREATGGLASRPEGFTIFLTTQSDEPPAGVFKQKLQYARGVRDGRIDDKRFLPVLYEFPPAMIESKAYLEKNNFHITNPNIDASVDREFLERELDKANESGKESLGGFVSKHLNVEIGIALHSDRWAGADYWEKQQRPEITLESILERSEVVSIGIDGGGLDDLLALYVIGRDAQTRKWLGWGHAWAHTVALERRKSEASRLLDFVRDGDLTLVETLGSDIDDLAEIVARIDETGLLDKIGVDQHGIGAIVDAIAERGVDLQVNSAGVPTRIVGISQGWKLVGSIKTTERKLAEGEFEVAAQPLALWCAGNAKVEPRGNAVIITKQAAGTAKIDMTLAAFDAVALMALNPQGLGSSIAEFLADPIIIG